MQSNIALGQNFLVDKNIIEKIISYIPLQSEVLEIGPGMGALSTEIAKKTNKFKMIEKDIRMVQYLSKNLNNEIIFGDCLKMCLDSEIIITNLPYNISNNFLYKIIQETKYQTLLIMLQRELAERLIKANCATGILLNLHGTIEPLIKVNKMCFKPQPSVDSTFLRIRYKKNLNEKFIRNIRSIFLRPNKKIKNNFKELEGLRANSVKIELFETILQNYYKT